MIALRAEPFDASALLAEFTARAAGAGAIVSFTGLVRDENDGGAVLGLELDHHPRLTEQALHGVERDAVARFDLLDIAIVHRHGALAPGEPIVFVAAAAAHRRSAFDAVDYVMDRLKTDVPFWKRERRDDGAHWLEARAGDHEDRRRW
ncbi:MAG TPA: molybdenum cofactor biosynthesis protein MoaE [Allosphingosinicella sp.]|jgi:molybdopterin synthase catalytic subunit